MQPNDLPRSVATCFALLNGDVLKEFGDLWVEAPPCRCSAATAAD